MTLKSHNQSDAIEKTKQISNPTKKDLQDLEIRIKQNNQKKVSFYQIAQSDDKLVIPKKVPHNTYPPPEPEPLVIPKKVWENSIRPPESEPSDSPKPISWSRDSNLLKKETKTPTKAVKEIFFNNNQFLIAGVAREIPPGRTISVQTDNDTFFVQISNDGNVKISRPNNKQFDNSINIDSLTYHIKVVPFVQTIFRDF